MMRHINRALVFAHRWGGIALCVLVVLWFFSGIVMLYVGYPKLTPAERLSRLPVLDSASCCISLSDARRALPQDAQIAGVALTSVAGQPVYRFDLHHGHAVVDALSGKMIPEVTPERALASGRYFIPGAEARYVALRDSDIWTRGSRLNPHRPLHRVQMSDPQNTVLYVSSTTGEVVRDATGRERAWNYVGPWLHWLHAFRSPDSLWRIVIIGTSLAGLILAITGATLGILRWRFKGSYGSGRKTPYREKYMRWHHISGLLFAMITLTWLFSGLMSVNPWGVFGGSGMRHGTHAAAGPSLSPDQFAVDTRTTLSELRRALPVRELEWHVLNGAPYIVARDSIDHTRIRMASPDHAEQLERFTTADIAHSASLLKPGVEMTLVEELTAYDEYYYDRAVHTLRGADERRLPVVRVQYKDPEETWAYVDPHTGAAVMWVTAGDRAQRWLFLLLHSWDTRAFLASPMARDAVLILLSLGGLAVSATGSVIGFRRLRNKVRS